MAAAPEPKGVPAAQASFDVEGGDAPGQRSIGHGAQGRRAAKCVAGCSAAVALLAGAALLSVAVLGDKHPLVPVRQGSRILDKFLHGGPGVATRSPLLADSAPAVRLANRVPKYDKSQPVMMITNDQRNGLSKLIGIKSTAYPSSTALSMSATDGSAAQIAAAKMDEKIFKLNKIIIDTVYDLICFLYPVTGGPRDYARFFVLETVARVPYFAYMSVMHLRESFGDRTPGTAEKMRAHYVEADNELHHLLIMESLGGNSSVIDRTLAQTMAFGYYWYVVAVYSISEQAAYHLSELIEDHAYNTYDGFLNSHEEMLKGLPVPDIARKYYDKDANVMLDLLCVVPDTGKDERCNANRPAKLESLYDVFVNIRNDEAEHWKTLCNLVQYKDMKGIGEKIESTQPAPPALSA